MSDDDALEFRFRWDRSEHRRFIRAVQRRMHRGSKGRLALKAILGVGSAFALFSMANGGLDDMGAVLVLLFASTWLILDRWGIAYLGARTYARNHAACIPNDQVRELNRDGITARCTTSTSSIQWSGIMRVQETPEFFVFYTSPSCAFQLPKRAVGDPEGVRDWIRRAVHAKGLSTMALELAG
jgi:hypothetical protein